MLISIILLIILLVELVFGIVFIYLLFKVKRAIEKQSNLKDIFRRSGSEETPSDTSLSGDIVSKIEIQERLEATKVRQKTYEKVESHLGNLGEDKVIEDDSQNVVNKLRNMRNG